MTRRIITECPACTTQFQVTDGQLKIANGQVRCGACLEVFNAELYSSNPVVTDTDITAKATVTEPSADTSIQSSDHNLLDKGLVVDLLEVPGFITPQPRQFGTMNNGEPFGLDHDEALAKLLNQTTDTAEAVTTEVTDLTSTAEPTPVRTCAEPELDLDKPVQEYITQSAIIRVEKTDATGNTETPVTTSSIHLSDEIHLEEIVYEPATTAQYPHLTNKKPEKHTSKENASATSTDVAAPEAKTAPPFTAVRAEPIMISTMQQPSGVSGLWALYCLIAALLLASQYLWFNRTTLANQPELANIYEIICQKIECKLPVPQDISSINTAKLVVQEHQEYQGALSVNLLLENQATYAQPYPAILLSFSDRKGTLINQRLFQPREYLHESIADLTSMPVNQTFQISLDILDPGRRAVSYQSELRTASL